MDFLRPTGFAANTRMWSDQIRSSDTVRWVHGRAARSLIHERDIADVAVNALTRDGHHGARYVLSGPEALTQIQQVHTIGDAIGRPLLGGDGTRTARGPADGVPETALDTWASFVETPEIVSRTVYDVTGTPPRPFAEWAREHAADFR